MPYYIYLYYDSVKIFLLEDYWPSILVINDLIMSIDSYLCINYENEILAKLQIKNFVGRCLWVARCMAWTTYFDGFLVNLTPTFSLFCGLSTQTDFLSF